MTLLVVDGLRGEEVAGISFEVAAGEVVALAGPAAAGTRAVLRMLGGQLRPAAGRVRLGDDDVTGASPRTLFRLGVGRTFHPPAFFPSMTVRENGQVALVSARNETGWWRAARQWRRSQADLLLDRVGLLQQADRPALALLPVDRRRLDLALALAGRPRLLLLDEPLLGLTETDCAALLAGVTQLAQERDVAVLMTASDATELGDAADKVLELEWGQVVARRHPAARRARRGFGV